MTRRDFEESLNAVLVEHLDESITQAELTALQRAIVARVQFDWDPFEDADPLELGDDGEAIEEDSPLLDQEEGAVGTDPESDDIPF